VRYILPLVAPVVVIVGVATERLARWLPYGLGWIPLALLVALQSAIAFPAAWNRGREYAERVDETARLSEFLRSNQISAVYTPYYGLYTYNWRAKEEFCFSELGPERYPPYAVEAELAANIAVAKDYRQIERFLACAGGAARTTNLLGMDLHYDFTAPTGGLQRIGADQLKGISDSRGRSIAGLVADHDLGTRFRPPESGGGDEVIIAFNQPTTVTAVRILNPNAGAIYPLAIGVEGGREDGGWDTIVETGPLTRYFWSGSRPYWAGAHYRAVCRFAPVTVSELKIVLPQSPKTRRWSLSELDILGPGPDQQPLLSELPALIAEIESKQIEHLYSDRSTANSLYQALGGKLHTEREGWLPDYFPPTIGRHPVHGWLRLKRAQDRNEPNEVVLAPHTAFLTLAEDARLHTGALSARNVEMRTTSVGPWVLFDFEPGQWREEYRGDHGLYWNGLCCLPNSDKRWAAALILRAERERARSDADESTEARAAASIKEALAAYPDYRYSLKGLQLGSKGPWTPEVPAGIQFCNGVRFEGISATRWQVAPGDTLELKYYWSCRPQVKTEALAAFVHIKSTQGMFQDDHVLLAGHETGFQPFPEIFAETRQVAIPRDAGPGPYHIWIGLHDRDLRGKRVRLATEFPVKSRAVRLPVELQIGDPPKDSI